LERKGCDKSPVSKNKAQHLSPAVGENRGGVYVENLGDGIFGSSNLLRVKKKLKKERILGFQKKRRKTEICIYSWRRKTRLNWETLFSKKPLLKKARRVLLKRN
jgi:hypothetical protein